MSSWKPIPFYRKLTRSRQDTREDTGGDSKGDPDSDKRIQELQEKLDHMSNLLKEASNRGRGEENIEVSGNVNII